MLQQIFPEQFDNQYRGRPIALWLLCPLAFVNLVIDLVAIFSRDGGAQSADGIPLNTFGAEAARAVIGAVAFLGLAKLLMTLLFILALIRYRAMIPLLYLVLVVDYLGHRGIGWLKPIARDGTHTGGHVTLVLFVLSVVGLVLSLSGDGYRDAATS